MSKAFDFCIPTLGKKVPHTPDWIHEIKYDGYRLRLERDGDRVRLFTRNGYDWTKRYPWIVESALKHRRKSKRLWGRYAFRQAAGTRSDLPRLSRLSSREGSRSPLILPAQKRQAALSLTSGGRLQLNRRRDRCAFR